jgi:hypothetical protein
LFDNINININILTNTIPNIVIYYFLDAKFFINIIFYDVIAFFENEKKILNKFKLKS